MKSLDTNILLSTADDTRNVADFRDAGFTQVVNPIT